MQLFCERIGKRKSIELNSDLYTILDSWLIFLCSKYKLEKPELKFNFNWAYCQYDICWNIITLGENNFLDSEFVKISDYLTYKFDTNMKKVLFCLFHELAHHLQDTKCPVLFHKENIKQHDYFNSKTKQYSKKEDIPDELHAEYRKTKLESQADRIAIRWLKKYYDKTI